jgi:glycosyltransferase involved in cell wall biosynthesis
MEDPIDRDDSMTNVFILDKIEVPAVTGERKLVTELAKSLATLNREVCLYAEINKATVNGVKTVRRRDLVLLPLRCKDVIFQYQVSSGVFKKTFWTRFLGNTRFIYAFMGGDLDAIFLTKNRYALKLFGHLVDKIVVLAEYQKRYIEQLLDVDIVVIPPFIEQHGGKTRASTRRDQNMKLLFMGIPSPNKGLDVLLDAYGILLREYSDAELIIADSGEDAKASLDARQMIRRLKLEDKIRHVGVVDAQKTLSQVDLFVYPARTIKDTMAIPISILEALSVGTPAVSTAIGGVAEALPSRHIAHPGDHRSLYEAMSAALKEKHAPVLPSRFLKQNVLPQYLELYDAMIH